MTDERITAYLLEELSEQEAQQFEEQCFAQQEWPAADLDSAEEDLIEAYVRQELTSERRRRFEENYLTTEARKERVLLARSFLRVVCSAESPKLTWMQRLRSLLKVGDFAPQFAIPKLAGTVAILLVGLSLATLVLWSSFRTRGPQTFADINLAISSENRAESSQPKKVTLPLGKDALRISLTLPEPEPEGAGYRVQWEDVKGPLETLKIESQDAKSVRVVIPAESLSRGQYALKLFRTNTDGTERSVAGSYFFNVE